MADKSVLTPGSQTHSVIALGVGQSHSISRALDEDMFDGISDIITKRRRNLTHTATAVLSRVKEQAPGREFTVRTGLLLAGDNHLFICAVIQRVK